MTKRLQASSAVVLMSCVVKLCAPSFSYQTILSSEPSFFSSQPTPRVPAALLLDELSPWFLMVAAVIESECLCFSSCNACYCCKRSSFSLLRVPVPFVAAPVIAPSKLHNSFASVLLPVLPLLCQTGTRSCVLERLRRKKDPMRTTTTTRSRYH